MASDNSLPPSPSEVRLHERECRRRADEALRAAKRRGRSPRQQIELGLAGDARPGTLSDWVAANVASRADDFREAFRHVLLAVADCRSPLVGHEKFVDAFARLAGARPAWVRPPGAWRPRTHNAGRQFASLLRHLLAEYPVPGWLDRAWLDAGPWSAAARGWFVHVGRGNNLRTAAGLPFPLTKRMAHHALLADDDLLPGQALRWAQIVGLGGGERVARAAALTRLGEPAADEPFWLTFADFLAHNPMLDPRQVGPIVDYVYAQRFEPLGRVWDNGVFREAGPPQPGFSMKGRTAESLLRQVNRWHRRLARVPDGRKLAWGPSGIAGFDRVEGEPGHQRRFVVVELLTSGDLQAEGRAMRHCVYSYASSCARGRCAIFSLRRDAGQGLERRATVEVLPSTGLIIQVRGKCNAPPDPVDQRIIRAWAVSAMLTLGKVW